MIDEVIAAERIINVDTVLYWLGAILTLTAAVSAIALPIRSMLKKYKTALDKTENLLEAQAQTNAQYQSLIDESKADRRQLNADMAAIKTATLAQIKLEINKIADRALRRGHALRHEMEAAELLFLSYCPLGGNGITARKIELMRALPVKFSDNKREGGDRGTE